VTVFSGKSLLQSIYTDWVANFFAGSPTTISGVRVASADINGDGRDDLITAPGPNTDGIVRVYSGALFNQLAMNPAPTNTLWRPEWATFGAFVG
jgi:hypothetical protein